MGTVEPSIVGFIDAHPDNAAVSFRYAELLAHHGRNLEALRWFGRVLDLDPGDRLARHNVEVLRLRTASGDDFPHGESPRN
jgi:hypothetical protein